MYENNFDPFAHLRAIESGQMPASTEVRNWNFNNDGNIMGTITGFNSFEHPKYGEQHTVIVRLADTNELISAFLNGWLQEGIRRQNAQVGDLILIQFLGQQPNERFNRFNLEIQKTNPNSNPNTF
jgi:hypothetical protein